MFVTKKSFMLFILASVLFISTLNAKYPVKHFGYGFTTYKEIILNTPKQKLSPDEINGLLQMREEEKLARDVYLYLYKKWGLPIFKNISQSEQTHMDAIKIILDRYSLKDPIKNDRAGKFTSEKLSGLYKILIKNGSNSLIDALIVGATIEDLDIKDLSDLLETTDNKDIIFVYKNLRKGSRNHIRSFVRQLDYQHTKYKPKYISKNKFRKIISSKHEVGIIR